MASSKKLTLWILVLLFILSSASAKTFRCRSSGASCDAVVDYVTPNRTTLGSIQSLFGVVHLRSILGANNLPINTTGRTPVPEKRTVRIPFPCICRDGIGVSNGLPVYTVAAGDGLYHIAAEVFSNIVTFPEIQAANNITDADVIIEGTNLTIPLPCSCDPVGGLPVVHYGHEVAPGSSVEGIAQQYNVSQDTLMLLNNLTGPQDLKADDVIDVPLTACSSMISNNSLDYPLLVPSNAYVVTANTCVKCKCDIATNSMLQCEPAGINSSCPLIRCAGSQNLLLGNTTSSGCNATTCSYTGYNPAIQTMLDTVSTCPAPPPPPPSSPPPPPGSSATSLQGWRWNGLAIFIHAVMLCALFV